MPSARTLHVACVFGALLAMVVPAPANAQTGDGQLAAASAFAKQIVRLIGENRYAEAWASLYPLHQEAAPLDRYVACEDLTPIPGRITSLRTMRAWHAPVDIAGLPDRIPGTKVTLRIVITDASIAARAIIVKTVGIVRAGERWAWMLPPERYAAYLAGTCPR